MASDGMLADPPDIEALRSEVRIPPLDPEFELASHVPETIDMVHVEARRGWAKLFLFGPPGWGKTSLGELYAAVRRLPCFVQNCAIIQDVRMWFGRNTIVLGPRGSYTQYLPSPLVWGLELGRAVVILDEINTAPHEVTQALYSLLDEQRRAYVHELDPHILVADGVTIIATMSIGADYLGEHPLDPALATRLIPREELGLPSEPTLSRILVRKAGRSESIAKRPATLVYEIHKQAAGDALDGGLRTGVGLREVLEAARYIADGHRIASALRVTVLYQYSAEARCSLDGAQRSTVPAAVRARARTQSRAGGAPGTDQRRLVLYR
jgi:MoxR-like ATPase